MADKLKITQQAYSNLEKGSTALTMQKIERICKIFKIHEDDFLTINLADSKVKNRATDSFNVRVLKQHYEIKLLEQNIKIRTLEDEIRRLKRIKAKYEEKK